MNFSVWEVNSYYLSYFSKGIFLSLYHSALLLALSKVCVEGACPKCTKEFRFIALLDEDTTLWATRVIP